ncbi:TonB-dependent receptor [uncultured Maribacter sp.]|uniref:SusC/RagA family TonB-linked outer membrane protein n=1 Tax=uncultured Maribacter sp. TaxID=431308 RepID=UPI0026084D98|nr:TonB-dependent receptor [uncultured Maribacter sp.]
MDEIKPNARNQIYLKLYSLLIALMLPILFYGQELSIKGLVSDSETNQPIPGVNIVLKGTKKGTNTNFDGEYTIEAKVGDVLQFSYLGFKTEEIVVSKSTLNISLMEDSSMLDEVVVIGYGTSNIKETTGAIANVKIDDIPNSATTSVDQMLQGRVSGLNLGLSSAQPGARVSANIRADISPRGSGEPLYVIDGVPMINDSPEPSLNDSNIGFAGGVDRSPLATINPSDIETVDVIKDASTTAIYGSAAANGVIFITTKKGKVGKTTVSYRATTSTQTPKKYIQFLNARDFMLQHNRLAYDKYLFDNKYAPYGAQNVPINDTFNPFFSQSDINNIGEGTNYLNQIIRLGMVQEHNISISGGSENTRIYSSFNYFNNEAILKGGDFERFTGRFNIIQKLGKKFNLNIKTNFSQVNSNNASSGENGGGSEKFNMLQAAYTFAPTISPLAADGNFSRSYNTLIMNPLAFLTIEDKLRTNRFSITPKLDIKLRDNLTLTTVGSMDRTSANRQFYIPSTAQHSLLPDGMAQLATNKNDAYTGESYLSYNKSFGKNSLSAVLGAGVYKTIFEGFSMQGIGFFTDALGFNNIGAANELLRNTQSSFKSETTRLSQFARINYTINGKYVLNGVLRRDGASNFAENNKWGVFPGISAAWRISEENFLKDTKVSQLKLRVGYGEVGNVVLADNALQLYDINGQFTFGSTVQPGVVLSQVANPDLTWETNASIDIGLDFGFFNNRITGNLEVYQKTARDLIDFDPLPSNNAVGRVVTNVGSTRAKGIDFALNTTNIITENFEWNTNFTFSTSRAEWIDRNPNVPLAKYIDPNGQIGDFFGWETDGIIKSLEEVPNHMAGAFPGNIRYVDQNGDGILDIDDVVKIGTWGPRVNFGVGTSFKYKNLTLSAFAYGNAGAPRAFGYLPADLSTTVAGLTPSNTQISVKDTWSVDNPNGYLPGIATNPYTGNNPTDQQRTDFLYKKVSFLRLKNINIGYDFSFNKASKIPISKLRLFVDLQNVALFTNYDGFDPEFDVTNPYPQALTSTLGLDIQF